MKNILVVAAHPDDEILGVGGTVRRLANEGCIVRAVILGEGITSRKNMRGDSQTLELENLKNDARKSAKIIGFKSVDFFDFPDNRFDSLNLLDVIKCISEYVEKYNPDTIFTHHSGDLNIDHQYTFKAVTTLCRPVNGNKVKKFTLLKHRLQLNGITPLKILLSPIFLWILVILFSLKQKQCPVMKVREQSFPTLAV